MSNSKRIREGILQQAGWVPVCEKCHKASEPSDCNNGNCPRCGGAMSEKWRPKKFKLEGVKS